MAARSQPLYNGSVVERPIGTELGGYRLEQLLSADGASCSYRAIEIQTAQLVHLTVHAERRFRPGTVESYVEGRRALTALSVSGWVRILDADIAQLMAPFERLAWEAREWVELGTEPPSTLERWLDDAVVLCQVVRAFHQLGRVVGDVHPGLVLRDRQGRARFVAPMSLDGDRPSAYHSAPEAFRDGVATSASDIFALGRTLHHLLDGGHGYEDVELLDSARADIDGGRLSWRRLGVPDEVCRLVTRMVSTSPGDRPSIEEVAHALESIARQRTSFAPLGTVPEPLAWRMPPHTKAPSLTGTSSRSPWWRRLFGRG